MDYQGYTGSRPMMPMAPWYGGGMMAQGCCRKCGQPSAACCCGCRECRREAKELLVAASAIRQGASDEQGPFPTSGLSIIRSMHADALDSAAKDVLAAAAARGIATGTAFIGGGCCVALAVEYAPVVATAPMLVAVLVRDADGTIMAWLKIEPAGTGYRVHECIITTKPGATLLVEAVNCTARVRWCEVFSC